MPDDPTFVSVRARDVKPYHYAIWCSIEGGQPFANAICHVRWSEDGHFLWFGLDSHNSYKADPDEVLELIDLAGVESWERSRQRHKDWTLPPPGMEFHAITGEPIPRCRPRITDATVEQLRAELARRGES